MQSHLISLLHHGILLSKMGSFGFSRGACLLMQTYLEDWMLNVKIGFSHSFPGVAPLLFTIFINDLPDCSHYSKSLIYAYDIKIFKLISDPEAGMRLQEDLNSITHCIEKIHAKISELTFKLS